MTSDDGPVGLLATLLLAMAGMATFLAMIFIIGKAETDKARAKSAEDRSREAIAAASEHRDSAAGQRQTVASS